MNGASTHQNGFAAPPQPTLSPIQLTLNQLLVRAQKLSAEAASSPMASDAQAVVMGLQQAIAQSQSQALSTLPTSTLGAVTETDPTTQQTYVSAPAVGAIAIVAALVGAAGGYAGRGYMDTKKHHAREAAEEEETETTPAKKRVSTARAGKAAAK